MTRTDDKAQVSTILEMLQSSRTLFGSELAVAEKSGDGYVGYTYDRLAGDAERLGAALRCAGFCGKHIAICGANGYRWVQAYLAVTAFCGVAVPLSRTLSPADFAAAAGSCDIAALIYDDSNASLAGSLPDSVEKLAFSEFDAFVAAHNGTAAPYTPTPDGLCELAFTSGTEDRAKAVMLTHENITFTLTELRCSFSADSDDVLYSVLPLTHAYERICGMLYPLYSGASVAYGEGLRRLTLNLRQVRPTKLLCVPLILDRIYKKIWENIEKKGIGAKVRRIIKLTKAAGPLRTAVRRELFAEIHDSLGGRLSYIITGGSSANPDTIYGLREFGIRTLQGYGLTESAALVSVNRPDRHEYDSAGPQTPGGLIDIYNIQSDGIGEIRYRGKNVMSGYYKQPALTAKALRDGWLYTSDMGYLDPHGFLHIIGRKRNLILTAKQKQVFPEELEALLMKNPFVSEAVVVGVPDRDDYAIVALIYPDFDSIAEFYGDEYLDSDVLRELNHAVRNVNAATEPYKQITRAVLRREPFEKNESGKIKRSGLKTEG